MDQITIVNNHVQYTYFGYDEKDLKDASYSDYGKVCMMGVDILEFCRSKGIDIHNMAIINDFRVQPEFRGKGLGSKAIKSVVDYLKNVKGYKIIGFHSRLMKADYPVEPDNTGFAQALADQGYFLEKNGFRAINAICCFESSNPYIYMDSDSKDIIKEIIKIEFYEIK